MTFSITVKESIKTALALTIAYGIALSLDWDTPMWAGFAVIFVSLSTSGQSFNKSAMRMFGTLIAGSASLTLIALFPQDRWLYILALSLYVGFCTYMMGGARHQYFWFVCGYVCIIVSLEAGPNPVAAFTIAILRAKETGLGIIVYSVVTSLLWRSNSADHFKTTVTQLQATQHQLYRTFFNSMVRQGHEDESSLLITTEAQQLTQFKTLLLAAETDSYEIGGLKQQWRNYQNQRFELTAVMQRWHDGFRAVQALDYRLLIVNLAEFDGELEARFVQTQRMFELHSPDHQPQFVELKLDKSRVSALSHFQKAALLETVTNLQQLEQITAALFNSMADIQGLSDAPGTPVAESTVPTTEFTFDIERLAGAVQVMATIWISFLLFIYVYDLPTGISFVIFSSVMAMPLASGTIMRISSMFVPFMSSVLICGFLYAFILPQLSSFIGLGTMLFLVTFLMCYFYSTPQKGLYRAASLSVFVTMIGINNEQSYNILTVYNTGLMFLLAFILWFTAAYIPFSPRPEKAFIRLLSRFFRSSVFLISTLSVNPDQPLSFWQQRRKAFHLHEIKTLPDKIEKWRRLINSEIIMGSSGKQVDLITPHLQMINLRLQTLLEACSSPQAQFLIDALQADRRLWRTTLKGVFESLSIHPMIENQTVLRSELTKIIAHLESRIESLLNTPEADQLTLTERTNFYHLLAAYRGVTDRLLDYTGNAKAIQWERWSEARL